MVGRRKDKLRGGQLRQEDGVRKRFFAVVALVVAHATVSTNVNAQNEINLNASASTLTFTGQSSPNSIGLTLGNLCPNRNSLCTASFNGGPTQHYDIFVSAGTTITLTLMNAVTGLWSVSQSKPLTFEFCSNIDCSGAGNVIFLEGSLQLVDLTQVPGAKTGFTNFEGVFNLTGLSGTLASSWTPTAVVSLNLKFKNLMNLESLLNKTSAHRIRTVKIGSGTVDPTPEPASMLLFGSGLLALGLILRRRSSL